LTEKIKNSHFCSQIVSFGTSEDSQKFSYRISKESHESDIVLQRAF
jgi:hypothetical protein